MMTEQACDRHEPLESKKLKELAKFNRDVRT